MRIGNASKDENNRQKNGKLGDQTGVEVYVRAWYDRGWRVVARAKDPATREKIAALMEQACANNNIGYDQNNRNNLLTLLKKNGFNFKTVGKTETDCSALVATICIACGIPESLMVVDGNLCWTGNLEAQLRKSGKFDFYDGDKFLKKTGDLRRGDILIAHNYKTNSGHAAVALDNGENIKDTSAPATPAPAPVSDLKVGQEVKLVKGSTYSNGQKIPSWVFNTKLYVRAINGDNITISTQKSGVITGVVKKSSLQGYTNPAAAGWSGTVRVNSYLNVRSGPGSSYSAIGRLYNNNKVTIIQEKNGWGNLSTGGWVSLTYIKKS